MVNCQFATNKTSLKNIATHVTEINWHLNQQIISNHLAMGKFDGSKMLEYIWVVFKPKLMKKFLYNFLIFLSPI
jgi:hypothetical protein